MLSVCCEYKLYPSPEQEERLLTTLEVCRHLYNGALAERIDAWRHEQRRVTLAEQSRQLPILKRQAQPLAGLFSQVAQEVLKRLDRAFENFFRRVRDGKPKPGFPRFKSVGRYRSFTYKQWNRGVKLNGESLLLSKIGSVSIRLHRPLQGTPKTCTISHKADGWYAAVSCQVEPQPLPKTGQEVGIDVGIENFATLTDEHEPIANPRPLQKAHQQLKKAQRRLERRTRRDKQGKLLAKQSRRREKAKLLLAKAHQQVARARADFAHKTARSLVSRFDVIYVEKLSIGNMLKNPHLAKHIADAGWGQFLRILKDKAARAVRQVIEVNPCNTSQNCSSCGAYVPKALSVRTHQCPYCGVVLHRDKNAAENIRKAGRQSLSALGRDAAVGRQRSALAQA